MSAHGTPKRLGRLGGEQCGQQHERKFDDEVTWIVGLREALKLNDRLDDWCH